ncbi:MAG: hypothetical protein JWM98_1452 [Thermoleophilia bacterium]|nr:hypothetical protein [Thermoleophilia bacterium]
MITSAPSSVEYLLYDYERLTFEWETSYGISANERRLLVRLAGPTTSDALVAASGLDEGTVAATLSLLERAALVDQTWSDAPDDTCSQVVPTPRGVEIATHMAAELDEMMRPGHRGRANR